MTPETFLASLPGAKERHSFKHEERTIQPVRKIVVRGALDLYFSRSETPHLVAAGETAETLRRIKTTIEGDTLTVEMEGVGIHIAHRLFAGGNISIGGGIIINGQRIDTGSHGAGRAVVGVALPQIPSLRILGSGDAYLMDLLQDDLDIEVQGSGEVAADGQVNQLNVRIAGSGDVDAKELVAQTACLSITGSGDISAHACREVSASIAGSGDIVVRGNPASRKEQVVGSGRVKFKSDVEPRDRVWRG